MTPRSCVAYSSTVEETGGRQRIRVADLGVLEVHVDGAIIDVRGRRSQALVGRLLLAGEAGVATDDLIDAIWPTATQPPTARQSLLNTVAQLRKRVDGLLETTAVGYRVGERVESDRAEFSGLVAQAERLLDEQPLQSLAALDHALHLWRGEPWPGVGGDWALEADRYRMCALRDRAVSARAHALLHLKRTDEAAEILAELVECLPLNERIWSDFVRALSLLGRRVEALRAIARARTVLNGAGLTLGEDLASTERQLIDSSPTTGVRHLEPPTSPWKLLQRTVTLWETGKSSEALRELHTVADEIRSDDVRRLARCIRVLEPSDGWARCMWRDLVSLPDRLPARAERVLISMDACALEHTDHGLAIAEREVVKSRTQDDRVRALRVRFMAGLGQPIDDSLEQTVSNLGTIISDDAMIESARFAAILAVKTGDFEAGIQLLAEYDELVNDLRPDWLDDFALLSAVVLDMCGVVDRLRIEHSALRLFPVLFNMYTVDVARFWTILNDPDPKPDRIDAALPNVIETLPQETGLAFTALTAHRLRRLDTSELMEELADQISRQMAHRYSQLGPVVLGRYAIECGDRDLAKQVARSLSPWSGEQLGLWPLDLICGSASELIDELEAV